MRVWESWAFHSQSESLLPPLICAEFNGVSRQTWGPCPRFVSAWWELKARLKGQFHVHVFWPLLSVAPSVALPLFLRLCLSRGIHIAEYSCFYVGCCFKWSQIFSTPLLLAVFGLDSLLSSACRMKCRHHLLVCMFRTPQNNVPSTRCFRMMESDNWEGPFGCCWSSCSIVLLACYFKLFRSKSETVKLAPPDLTGVPAHALSEPQVKMQTVTSGQGSRGVKRLWRVRGSSFGGGESLEKVRGVQQQAGEVLQ